MRHVNPWVKAALEYGPLIAFFVAFRQMQDRTVHLWGTDYSGIVVATLIFIPLLAAATLALRMLTGRLSAMQVITLVLVVVFGGLSVWLNDPRFFKMKPTLIYLIFAALLGAGLALRRNWLGMVLGNAVPLRDEGWQILTSRLALLFLGLAAANELIWRTQSDGTWVNFKTFGLPLLILLFFVLNSGVLRRYALPEEVSEDGSRD